jgi:protein-disulfide isomerase
MSPPAVVLGKAAFAGDQKLKILGDIRIPWLPPPAFTAFALLLLAHSPVPGRQGAPVTIVEFFDPACETCRAICPIVESPMAKYREDVRLVVRDAPIHPGPARW